MISHKCYSNPRSKDSSSGFQASYEISFFVHIRKPLSTSSQTSDVTPKIIFSQTKMCLSKQHTNWMVSSNEQTCRLRRHAWSAEATSPLQIVQTPLQRPPSGSLTWRITVRPSLSITRPVVNLEFLLPNVPGAQEWWLPQQRPQNDLGG